MAETVYAIIRPADYQAFLDLAGNDFPDSYGTWLYEYKKRANQDRGAGWIVETQEVFAAELALYCKKTASAPTQFNLDVLAREKHMQRQEKEKDKSTKIKQLS